MNFKVTNEQEILQADIRKKILEEVTGRENQVRKEESYKRYLAFKDKARRLVIQQLSLQFDMTTIQEMAYAISNISLVKKVIGKLARVYSNGVTRSVTIGGKEVEEQTKKLQALEGLLDFNSVMKKTNRILKLQHNTLLYVRPQKVLEDEDSGYKIKIEALQPYLYDVIPFPGDPTQPWIVILSPYRPPNVSWTTANTAIHTDNNANQVPGNMPMSDGTDQAIADPDDESADEFIWWSPNFHFTTNCKGEIVSDPVNEKGIELQDKFANPISKLPFVHFAIEQDGEFWAIGGDDLIDGGILVNSMISQTNHIAVTQGYGQFWMKGKNLPRNQKIGPSKAILMEQASKDDPEPSIGFASANPNLESLCRLVEMYVALLLTTNNLSSSSVQSTMSGGKDFASGIAMMIDKAESMEDVQDQEQIFRDKEPEVWELVRDWSPLYIDKLEPEFKENALPSDDFDVTLKFNPPQAVQSEGDKLDNLQKRKNLGINTLEDLIMMDNPGLTKDEAQAKLKQIEDEAKLLAGRLLTGLMPGNPQGGSAGSPSPKPSPKPGQPGSPDNQPVVQPDPGMMA